MTVMYMGQRYEVVGSYFNHLLLRDETGHELYVDEMDVQWDE